MLQGRERNSSAFGLNAVRLREVEFSDRAKTQLSAIIGGEHNAPAIVRSFCEKIRIEWPDHSKYEFVEDDPDTGEENWTTRISLAGGYAQLLISVSGGVAIVQSVLRSDDDERF